MLLFFCISIEKVNSKLNLRIRHLYGNSDIKIIIWDRLLEFIRGVTAPNPHNLGIESSISLGSSPYTIVSSINPFSCSYIST